MLDCGTQFNDAVFLGFHRMAEAKPFMGAVCCEIEVSWNMWPIGMAQFIEYKIDQVLKSAEGLYGLV